MDEFERQVIVAVIQAYWLRDDMQYKEQQVMERALEQARVAKEMYDLYKTFNKQ
jgi:hypothetical protein